MDGAKIYSDVTKKNMIIMTEQWVLFIPSPMLNLSSKNSLFK